MKIYNLLFDSFGKQHWWPAKSPFEVMVGAILVQNTNWKNVETAIKNLKRNKALTATKIDSLPIDELAEMIRPSGYFNIKAKRLKSFVNWYLIEYRANIKKMILVNDDTLREQLLSVNGVGEETADSILLYATQKPSFVIDAYTRRIFSRLGLCDIGIKYHNLRKIFMSNLPKEHRLYNEYHALLVTLAKEFCHPKPNCKNCPLVKICKLTCYRAEK